MQVSLDRASPIGLRRLLPDAVILGADDICVQGCTCDSRRLKPGDLFAALVGTDCDGHDFIPEALARGASAILTQRPVEGAPCPVCIVRNTRDAFGRVCQALAGDPSRRLKVIGITGTNGKTTTSCLIASILATAGRRVGILGTLGYFDGVDAVEGSHTTPPAEDLARWLARMVANDCSHAVMEVSSHALHQSRVAGVVLDAACVTNVRRDHFDYHRTAHDYRLAKSKLFDHLAAEGFAVINADDPTAAGYLHLLDGPVLTVATRSAAEITGRLLERSASEQTFLLSAGSECVPVRTQMIGDHHISNCLVATAVGLAYGINLTTVVRGLEAVGHVPGRLERIECGQPFGVFVDFAHTPDALENTLRTLRDVTSGRLICVFGAGGDRDREKRPLMGQVVEKIADRAIVTSDNPRGEDPQKIIRQILDGFRCPSQARVIVDRAEAIRAVLAQEARPGDCVLIAGKGHETHQIVGQDRLPFDDREIAREWLYESQPGATLP
jgi:UDP-N-acetylmuramoyl-L-alanyl-D-glutamate--2,6-diaminopimelate ligase